MRILRIGLVTAVGLGVFGIDVGESVRTGAISDGCAQAKHHHHHRRHRSRRRHRKHHRRPPPQEM